MLRNQPAKGAGWNKGRLHFVCCYHQHRLSNFSEFPCGSEATLHGLFVPLPGATAGVSELCGSSVAGKTQNGYAMEQIGQANVAAEYIKGDRFSQEFTDRRASSLDRFLTRLTFHPVLRRTPLLSIFLESNDWNAHMRTRPTRAGAITSSESGVLESFGDAFLNAFSKVHKPDKRFTEVREKADKLDEDLSHIEKTFTRLTRRQALLEQDYADMHTHVSKMATVESSMESVFNTFGLGLEVTKQGVHELREQSDVHYLSSLRDMESYIVSVKALLKNRDQKQLDFEALTEYLVRAVSERDALVAGGGGGFIRNKIEDIRGVNHEQSRKSRAGKLEHKIDELRLESEEARKLSEAFDEEVIREMSEFERIKAVEMKQTLGELAGAHIKMYQHVIDEWSRIIPEMASDAKGAQDNA